MNITENHVVYNLQFIYKQMAEWINKIQYFTQHDQTMAQVELDYLIILTTSIWISSQLTLVP